MPDGNSIKRKFLRSNTLGDIMNFYKVTSDNTSANVKLLTTFPKKVLDDANMTLEDCKFGKQESLIV